MRPRFWELNLKKKQKKTPFPRGPSGKNSLSFWKLQILSEYNLTEQTAANSTHVILSEFRAKGSTFMLKSKFTRTKSRTLMAMCSGVSPTTQGHHPMVEGIAEKLGLILMIISGFLHECPLVTAFCLTFSPNGLVLWSPTFLEFTVTINISVLNW